MATLLQLSLSAADQGQRLEAGGVIEGYTALLDAAAVGCNVLASLNA